MTLLNKTIVQIAEYLDLSTRQVNMGPVSENLRKGESDYGYDRRSPGLWLSRNADFSDCLGILIFLNDNKV
jgi:hypothetical protein